MNHDRIIPVMLAASALIDKRQQGTELNADECKKFLEEHLNNIFLICGAAGQCKYDERRADIFLKKLAETDESNLSHQEKE